MKDVSLLPGTYDLHTSVTDFNRQHEYDIVHLALRFDVMSGRPYESSGTGHVAAGVDDRRVVTTPQHDEHDERERASSETWQD